MEAGEGPFEGFQDDLDARDWTDRMCKCNTENSLSDLGASPFWVFPNIGTTLVACS